MPGDPLSVQLNLQCYDSRRQNIAAALVENRKGIRPAVAGGYILWWAHTWDPMGRLP